MGCWVSCLYCYMDCLQNSLDLAPKIAQTFKQYWICRSSDIFQRGEEPVKNFTNCRAYLNWILLVIFHIKNETGLFSLEISVKTPSLFSQLCKPVHVHRVAAINSCVYIFSVKLYIKETWVFLQLCCDFLISGTRKLKMLLIESQAINVLGSLMPLGGWKGLARKCWKFLQDQYWQFLVCMLSQAFHQML